jgi:hypothetical protein
MLRTSQKVRIAKKGRNAGKRYLIIPMQHNTPDNDALAPSMPQGVYDVVSQFRPSRIVGQTTRISGTGATVPQSVYNWGDRLVGSQMEGISDAMQKRYDGMYRFDTAGAGAVKHSSYLTFRVMGEWSSGWIVPAQPGRNFTHKVVSGLQPVAEQVLQKAVYLDIMGG